MECSTTYLAKVSRPSSIGPLPLLVPADLLLAFRHFPNSLELSLSIESMRSLALRSLVSLLIGNPKIWIWICVSVSSRSLRSQTCLRSSIR